jgi:hypothetical protein
MTEKFIYVFSKEARDYLLSNGFKLLKSDERNETYVFNNDPALSFATHGISVIRSNTLTF